MSEVETAKRAKDPLRLVLVGLQGVGKSAVGNTILGKEEFQSDISSNCLTRQSKISEGQVCGRQVTVVDTPGLFSNVLSDAQVKEELETALTLCAPGPHIFLFIIQLGRFTEQERTVLTKVNELLGSNVGSFSMVLFTYGDRLKNKTIDQFVKEDENLQRLIQKCGGQYHVFNNTDMGNGAQVSKLLDKIDSQLKRTKHPFFVKSVNTWVNIIYFAVPVLTLFACSAIIYSKKNVPAEAAENIGTSEVMEEVLKLVLDQPEKTVEAVLDQPEKTVEAVIDQAEEVLEAGASLWKLLLSIVTKNGVPVSTAVVGLGTGLWILKKLLKK